MAKKKSKTQKQKKNFKKRLVKLPQIAKLPLKILINLSQAPKISNKELILNVKLFLKKTFPINFFKSQKKLKPNRLIKKVLLKKFLLIVTMSYMKFLIPLKLLTKRQKRIT